LKKEFCVLLLKNIIEISEGLNIRYQNRDVEEMSSLSEPTKYYIDDFNGTEALEVKLSFY
jgi:hypothetical protein